MASTESFLDQALDFAPSLSSAKFDPGEISVFNRDWVEARKRFERILAGRSSRQIGLMCPPQPASQPVSSLW